MRLAALCLLAQDGILLAAHHFAAAGAGESTTMALVAERWGLIPELRSFAAGGSPIWGTCAGLIFLADRATGAAPQSPLTQQYSILCCIKVALCGRYSKGSLSWVPARTGTLFRVLRSCRSAWPSTLKLYVFLTYSQKFLHLPCAAGQKEGGQALLGGLDCLVQRNFFGAQVDSFETQLPAPPPLCAVRGNGAAAAPGGDSFRAMFIRAPAVLEAGASVEVLAEYRCVWFGCYPNLFSLKPHAGGRRVCGGPGRLRCTPPSTHAQACCNPAQVSKIFRCS